MKSKLKSEELLHVTCAHAKKLPNYPKIRFGVKSDTGDDLEIWEGKKYLFYFENYTEDCEEALIM